MDAGVCGTQASHGLAATQRAAGSQAAATQAGVRQQQQVQGAELTGGLAGPAPSTVAGRSSTHAQGKGSGRATMPSYKLRLMGLPDTNGAASGGGGGSGRGSGGGSTGGGGGGAGSGTGDRLGTAGACEGPRAGAARGPDQAAGQDEAGGGGGPDGGGLGDGGSGEDAGDEGGRSGGGDPMVLDGEDDVLVVAAQTRDEAASVSADCEVRELGECSRGSADWRIAGRVLTGDWGRC